MFSPLRYGLRDDRLDEQGELLGRPMRFGNTMLLDEVLLHLLGHAQHERRAHRAGGDGAHPDADGRQVARHRQRHAEDGRLGGAVGELAGLALDAGDRARC